ncbi:MAG: S8/S53 family peptidase [Candidatus Thermoplasmatota archaeon]|nr:S8/S53 family peptidase [Candidatus Thermoplasmatota archaeon]
MLACMLALATFPVAGAENAAGDDDIIIAVLDTGARITHQEFDYPGTGDGPAGQVVAWWDFTNELGSVSLPGPGDLWDDREAPYDNHGHGTATASVAAGETLSMGGHVKLAIGKVGTGSGSIQNLAEGYDWAVNTVGADVVSISIGSIVPLPGLFDSFDEASKWAREMGVLTVVSAGNGAGNVCGPSFTWDHSNGFSKHALAVGSLFESGGTNAIVTCSALDPDVASHGYNVPVASNAGDQAYTSMSGTSFAAPNVAGAAAHLMQIAKANGQDTSPEAVEDLILACADDGWPYHISGAGFFHLDQFEEAKPHAAAGTSCPAPTGTVSSAFHTYNEVYGSLVPDTMRTVFTEVADDDHVWALALTGEPTGTGPGVIGTSLTVGAAEVEVYETTLTAGSVFDLEANYASPLTPGADFDVGLFAPGALDDGVLTAAERVDWSANSGGTDEHLVTLAPVTGTYVVALWGWTMVEDQGVDLTLNSPGSLSFVTEEVALSQTTY